MIRLIAGEFLNMLRNFRIVHLAGRFGGGKTALASILAAYCVARGWAKDIIANYPFALANPNPIPPVKDTVVVVDEAWQFARDSRAIHRYAGFLRKLNNFLILPSVFPVSHNLSMFRAERVFNAYVVGFPAWIWRWWLLQRGYSERGYFAVINPHEIFSFYDSYSVDTTDGTIAELLALTVKSPAAPMPGQLPLFAEELTGAAETISESSRSLSESLERFAKRLRK